MFTWSNGEAPGHRRDDSGALWIGGVPAARLAAQYGTPLFVLDAGLAKTAIAKLRACCDAAGVGVSYAAKAFLSPEFARIVAAAGIGMDVCSLGELEVAEGCGFPARSLTMHGAGKTDEELRACLDARVGRIVLDGLCDLRRLAELGENRPGADVVLRINTEIESDAHPHVTTAGAGSKFGFARSEEAAAAAMLRATPALRFVGLHAHVGSQLGRASAFEANVGALEACAARLAALGLPSDVLVAGGGFGVQYDPRRPEQACDVEDAVRRMRGAMRSRLRLDIEPGRAIAAHAGTTIYRVLSVKRRGSRHLVVVDGGMADNPRPALYGAYHRAIPVGDPSRPVRSAFVYGRACESDFLAEADLPDDVRRGDLVAFCTTGAYTYSMSSNYNRFPRPAVVGVESGAHAAWDGGMVTKVC